MSKFQTPLNNQILNAPITQISTNYTALITDSIIEVTTLAAPINVTLPAPSTTGATPNKGKIWTISDASGLAGLNPITVAVTGGALINGFASQYITIGYGQMQVYCDGSIYTIISQASPLGSLTWSQASNAGPFTLNAGNGYFAVNGTLTTFNLPTAACNPGAVIAIMGVGAGLWQLNQSAGQQVFLGQSSTTLGATGKIQSAYQGASIQLLCTTLNQTFYLLENYGNIVIT